MTSSIGNNRRNVLRGRKGLSLVELLVAVAVLSVGVIAVYRAMFQLLDYQVHLSSRLYAMNFLENEIVLFQQKYQDKARLPYEEMQKSFVVVLDNRPIVFDFSVEAPRSAEWDKLLALTMTLSWQERGRTIHLSRRSCVERLSAEPLEN